MTGMAAAVIRGEGPPVVFVAQLGTAGASWQPVLERLTCGATTVTYDRPGLGGCPDRPAPNRPLPYSAFADELAVVLDDVVVLQPAVLVGHSVGSLIVRAFADRHPDRVAGVVHVDGSIPHFFLWPDGRTPVDGDGPHATGFDTVLGEVETLTATVPKVPTVVITRTPGRWGVALPHPGIDRVWSVHQQLLAEQCHAPLVVATDAGHQIPDEAPELVAHVVDHVVAAVRTGQQQCTLDPARLCRVGGLLRQVRDPRRLVDDGRDGSRSEGRR